MTAPLPTRVDVQAPLVKSDEISRFQWATITHLAKSITGTSATAAKFHHIELDSIFAKQTRMPSGIWLQSALSLKRPTTKSNSTRLGDQKSQLVCNAGKDSSTESNALDDGRIRPAEIPTKQTPQKNKILKDLKGSNVHGDAGGQKGHKEST